MARRYIVYLGDRRIPVVGVEVADGAPTHEVYAARAIAKTTAYELGGRAVEVDNEERFYLLGACRTENAPE